MKSGLPNRNLQTHAMVMCNFQLQFNNTAFLTDTTSVRLA